jgi:hypothetical protein
MRGLASATRCDGRDPGVGIRSAQRSQLESGSDQADDSLLEIA